MTRAYFRDRGEERRVVLTPDSAHGTNPASVRMAGFETRQIASDDRGEIDPDSLAGALGSDVAALMVTNPNTLGIFETRIGDLAGMIHEVGALLYMDGANMNALLGIARPGDMGVDLLHLNLHKTFSGPHGGGGPGAGPIAASEELAPYLPAPLAVLEGDTPRLDYDRPKAIGRLHGFFGNFGVMVRAYCYIRTLGAAGLREVSETAILHANYLMAGLDSSFDLPYDRRCQHEFVLSASRQKKRGVRALDIAKRLLDHGFHSPTVYFPLIVEEALMIEPTETETKETLDRFIQVMNEIAREAEEDPELLHGAPHRTPIRRVDEARAAREMDITWAG
jgi:glycine dehydrogenase subunit 2